LLIEFYKQTQRALKRGLENPMDKHALIRDCQHTARRLLEKEKIDAAFIEHLWQTMQDDYFLRYTPEQIAWHTLGMHTKKSAEPACCVILMQPTSTSGGTDIFVHASQQHPLFAIITATLDRLGLNIMEARIVPSKDRYSMDTYTVLEYDAKPIHDKSRLREIEQQLYAQLQSGVLPALLHRKDGGRRIEQFSVPTQVSFSDDETNHRTVMEVITTDRPGLLSRIARVLTECGIQLQNAKISTFGAQAEDVFFITDDQGAPVKGAATRDRIRQSICELLDVQSKKTATKK
jgi:[protein-PII] uridylyltransferase